MSLLLPLLAALGPGAVPPEFIPAAQRKGMSLPLTTFMCNGEGPDMKADDWAAVEIQLTDSVNLFAVNRRPDMDGKPRAGRVDGPVADYAVVLGDGGALSIFLRPESSHALQFEMQITAGATEIGAKTVQGYLTHTDSGVVQSCMIAPPFSPIGTAE